MVGSGWSGGQVPPWSANRRTTTITRTAVTLGGVAAAHTPHPIPPTQRQPPELGAPALQLCSALP